MRVENRGLIVFTAKPDRGTPQLELVANYVLCRMFGISGGGLLGAGARGAVFGKIVQNQQAYNTVLLELKFRSGLKRIADLSKADADRLWEILKAGIIEERALKGAPGFGGRTGPYSGAENVAYDRLASQMRGLLAGVRGKIALWSGGIGISTYASSLGYTCLETTRLGGVLEELKLNRNEKAIWDLWDYMAKVFVRQAGHEINIFVRTFDAKSTLALVELPTLLRHNPGLKFKWHVIVGRNDQTLQALTQDGQLAVETRGAQHAFDDGLKAEIALTRFKQRLPPAQRAQLFR